MKVAFVFLAIFISLSLSDAQRCVPPYKHCQLNHRFNFWNTVDCCGEFICMYGRGQAYHRCLPLPYGRPRTGKPSRRRAPRPPLRRFNNPRPGRRPVPRRPKPFPKRAKPVFKPKRPTPPRFRPKPKPRRQFRPAPKPRTPSRRRFRPPPKRPVFKPKKPFRPKPFKSPPKRRPRTVFKPKRPAPRRRIPARRAPAKKRFPVFKPKKPTPPFRPRPKPVRPSKCVPIYAHCQGPKNKFGTTKCCGRAWCIFHKGRGHRCLPPEFLFRAHRNVGKASLPKCIPNWQFCGVKFRWPRAWCCSKDFSCRKRARGFRCVKV